MSKLRNSLIILSLSLALFGTALVTNVDAQTGGCSTTHVVQRGENLYRIALRYRMTIADLQARNSISNRNLIYAGQRLCIAGGFVPPTTPIPQDSSVGIGSVTSWALNVRSGPGTQYGILSQARYGSTFPVIGRTADSAWYQITYDVTSKRDGWVFARYMSTVNPQDLPLVNYAPVPYSAQVRLASDATTYSGPTTLTAIPPYELVAGTNVLVVGRTDAADWFQVRLNSGTAWLRHDAFPAAMLRFEFPVTA